MGCDQLVNEGYTKVYFPPQGKLKRFMFHFRQGVAFQYPLCCILRFSFEMALLDGKTILIQKGQAAQRGSIKRSKDSVFVPCNFFHHKTEDI